MTLAGLIDGYSRDHRVTQRELACALGIGERTLRRRLTAPDGFTVGELRRLQALLHIPAKEMGETICGH